MSLSFPHLAVVKVVRAVAGQIPARSDATTTIGTYRGKVEPNMNI
jgi:hypothetical protein